MNKLLIFLAIAALPFLLVWAGFILTGFNYNPREVFNYGGFWGLSCLYWMLFLALSPTIAEAIDNAVE